jgi:hypothetical protein
MLTVLGAASNAPKEHVANVACNLRWEAREAVGRGTDFAKVTGSAEWEDLELFNSLWR